MTSRPSSANRPLWFIAGILAAAVVAWLVIMTVMMAAMMFAWGGWDGFGWGHMGGMGRMHGGGADTSNSAVVTGGMSETIDIRDFAFSPGNLQVPVGATLTWRNHDSAPHNATDRAGGWKTENLSDGESDSVTFDAPGQYDYYCTIHPSMKAQLTVR